MSSRRGKIAACLFLVVATLAVYGQLRSYQFISYDDNVYVYDNPAVQAGLTLKGLSWAFTTTRAGNWHPLTWLSLMLDCQLFGLNPGAQHLTNLAFHIASSLLLFLWLLYLTPSLGCSFMVAALFALHPMHVESVAWVAERKDVLSTFFWLLTMWAYVWYVKRPGWRRYLLILVCFSLGLMAKPMLVTLPFVLLLLDYWPLSRLSFEGLAAAETSSPSGPGVALRRLLWEKAPLFGLAALFSLIALYAQQEVGAVWTGKTLPFTMRLANALVAYVSYLGKMLWPVHLAVLYPHPHNLSLWQAVAAGLVLAALTILALRQARRHPYLLVGWLWYLGTLVPVIGLVQVGRQAMADRYTYVPFIGLFIAVVWGTAALAARWRASRFLLPVGAGGVLAALAVCTWVQVGYWRDSISLYEHTLKVTRGNPVTQNNLGEVLAGQGQLNQAVAHYTAALRLQPDFAQAHYNLGVALGAQGKLNQAAAQYRAALRFKPDFAEACNNLGEILAAQDKLAQAVAQYRAALRLRPDLVVTRNNLGVALANQGKIDAAITQFQKAIQIKPDFPDAYFNLGLALMTKGDDNQASRVFQNFIKIVPGNTRKHRKSMR
ncbi:MAG TPA: tetratricopeptide repeat protein [Desulfobaccales bacterium]|nr:tetratricopeptide repeat protein [Desulfobaccales bacterium]